MCSPDPFSLSPLDCQPLRSISRTAWICRHCAQPSTTFHTLDTTQVSLLSTQHRHLSFLSLDSPLLLDIAWPRHLARTPQLLCPSNRLIYPHHSEGPSWLCLSSVQATPGRTSILVHYLRTTMRRRCGVLKDHRSTASPSLNDMFQRQQTLQSMYHPTEDQETAALRHFLASIIQQTQSQYPSQWQFAPFNQPQYQQQTQTQLTNSPATTAPTTAATGTNMADVVSGLSTVARIVGPSVLKACITGVQGVGWGSVVDTAWSNWTLRPVLTSAILGATMLGVNHWWNGTTATNAGTAGATTAPQTATQTTLAPPPVTGLSKPPGFAPSLGNFESSYAAQSSTPYNSVMGLSDPVRSFSIAPSTQHPYPGSAPPPSSTFPSSAPSYGQAYNSMGNNNTGTSLYHVPTSTPAPTTQLSNLGGQVLPDGRILRSAMRRP